MILEPDLPHIEFTLLLQIIVEVRRLGGGFGGKISRPLIPFCAVAFASNKLGVPVKMHMTLNTNMEMIGKRHPVKADYKIGFDDEGKAKAVQIMLVRKSPKFVLFFLNY